MTLLIVLAYLLTLAVGHRMLGTSAKPAVMLLVIWTGVVVAPLVLVPEFHFSARAVFFIFAMLVCVLAGAVLGEAAASSPRVRAPLSLIEGSKTWILAGSASGFVACTVVLYSAGYGFSHFFDLDSYLNMAQSMTAERYKHGYRMPLFARVLMAPAHCAAMIAATRVATGVNRTRRDTLLGLLPFVPTLALAAIMTTRSSVLFMGVLYLSAYLAVSVYTKPQRLGFVITRANLIRGTAAGAAVSVLFFVLQIARIGEVDPARFGDIVLHLRKWPLGTVAGFSAWFEGYNFGREPWHYGYYTFTGVFSLLGIRSRVTGIYAEVVDLGFGDFANVFSAFRGLVMDYGVLGCAASMLLLGIGGSIAFRYARAGYVYAVGVLLCCYAFILFSPFVSFYAYTAHIAAIGLYFVYLSRERAGGRVNGQPAFA